MFYVFLFVLVIGIVIGIYSTTRYKTADTSPPNHSDQQKILKIFDTQDTLQNDDVERILDVSDSTAQRYLAAMTNQNYLQRHGTTGRGVHYTKAKK